MAIKINGKEMSKAWHYNMCIQHWNDVAENMIDKFDSVYIAKYTPENSCFVCEYHGQGEYGCSKCIFSKYKETDIHTFCQEYASPYTRWCVACDIYGERSYTARNCAIEIAQLFIDHYPEDEVSNE